MAWLTGQGRTGQWGTEPFSGLPERVAQVEKYAGTYLVRVAETAEGRVAGVCVLADEPQEYVPAAGEPELYVRLLVTDRALRGAGVGAALVADARAEAVRRGVGLLRVDCFGGGDGALAAQYERLGFTPSGTFTVERPGRPVWPGRVLEIRL
ncbi:GNAT family N-acetyltransferase [Streptomyces sp. WMMC500]|uniref:GNAT family N-acetyltransferase n=1 Tax=Streptomyces sp. WMMC500 TaxID=3015154 RepID=UPI00248CD206|nr:GNAT family N-acetyltransferase [Streptomyces sp. WMMC500]WBB64411.1 GNAT family N-acetyltransferase [Streptomyces sp. WMMC500]